LRKRAAQQIENGLDSGVTADVPGMISC